MIISNFFEEMGNLFTEEVGKVLTRLLGNYLTEALGKVLDIYRLTLYLPGEVSPCLPALNKHLTDTCSILLIFSEN
jgi:hypothetical protein